MSTLAQIEANRENATYSTGPKSPEGKALIRRNALKHGLLSKEVVIQDGEGKENKAEFRTLLHSLWDYLQPEGPVEEILVERIATSYWRLRRVLKCEVGEIRKQLDSASYRELFNRADQVAEAKKFLVLGGSKETLKKSSFGLTYLLEVLEDVKAEVEEEGCLSERAKEQLIKNFGDDENGITHWCYAFTRMALEAKGGAEENPNQPPGALPPDKCKEAILKLLDEEKAKLVGLKAIIEENELMELDAKCKSFVLPPKEAVEKILRYESSIERQLYRAMNQLERIQRQRRGEVVPPPISVELSTPA